MPIILQPEDTSIVELTGFHLFHFSMSSCSQRVRFVLDESNIKWRSHHIDLSKMENTSRSYQKIHPKGYVPAMVHDGKLITESSDIIRYINQFLGSNSEISDDELRKWLDISDKNQSCLKLLTYELLFKPRGHFSQKKDIDHYLQHQRNPELRQFLIEYVDGFSNERVQNNIDKVNDYLALLNHSLSNNEYLLGSKFSFADIANIVNVHRYNACSFDLKHYPFLDRWYSVITNRPAYKSAIEQWQM